MGDAGGYKSDDMGSAETDPAWQYNDPMVQIPTIVANGTRIWVYCGNGTNELGGNNIPPSSRGSYRSHQPHVPGQLHRGRRQERRLHFPDNGTHDWPYWGCAAAADEARPDRHLL
jgi:diacylglycerol O-acyltransferase/trehalose O-mycolyltransferase